MDWFEFIRNHFGKPENAAPTYTPRAMTSLQFARQEADRLKHGYIGTEHILLGLIALGDGIPFNILGKLGLALETTRTEVEMHSPRGDQKMGGRIPYTPRAKGVVEQAAREAKALNHAYVGTDHLLLGLLWEQGGLAARLFKKFNVDVEATRKLILEEISPVHPSEGGDQMPGE